MGHIHGYSIPIIVTILMLTFLNQCIQLIYQLTSLYMLLFKSSSVPASAEPETLRLDKNDEDTTMVDGAKIQHKPYCHLKNVNNRDKTFRFGYFGSSQFGRLYDRKQGKRLPLRRSSQLTTSPTVANNEVQFQEKETCI